MSRSGQSCRPTVHSPNRELPLPLPLSPNSNSNSNSSFASLAQAQAQVNSTILIIQHHRRTHIKGCRFCSAPLTESPRFWISSSDCSSPPNPRTVCQLRSPPSRAAVVGSPAAAAAVGEIAQREIVATKTDFGRWEIDCASGRQGHRHHHHPGRR